MGYITDNERLSRIINDLSKDYRLYAPVLKKGEGRFTDTDVVRYDFVTDLSEIELELKSDYAFKEFMLPLSETLFFFTENQVKEADIDQRDVIVFLRSCDMHAVRRLDYIYLKNGSEEDYFYKRLREKVKFALIGCSHSYKDCFCVSMGTNVVKEDYVFSIDIDDGTYRLDVKDEKIRELFRGIDEADVIPQYVVENNVKVSLPENVPLSIYKSPLWDEYTKRCVNCGRCTLVCPTCTCYTMQDVYYTDNGKVGERRRVAASCMIDGYTNVAGGGQYRKTNGERMRFKVLHKIHDFKARTGYNMCVGCGRCDMVCPEYISFSNIINKVSAEVRKEEAGDDK
ncbi:MAG: anaerobic sulfite reductase subunit A [Firmicutes bacterium]|nr:anaerobic sulfite reductase subunit A [Bacillota bacterium]